MNFPIFGYQQFRRFFSLSEISLAEAALKEVIQATKPNTPFWENACAISDLKPSRNPGVSTEAIKDVPFIINELPKRSDLLKDLLCREELWAMAQEILNSNEVIYHFSNVTRKPAYIGPNMSWHRDYPNQYICP